MGSSFPGKSRPLQHMALLRRGAGKGWGIYTLAEGMERCLFCAHDHLLETGDLLDTWMVAGLVAREMQGIISDEEKQALQNWLAESENHRRYALLQKKANLQKMVR